MHTAKLFNDTCHGITGQQGKCECESIATVTLAHRLGATAHFGTRMTSHKQLCFCCHARVTSVLGPMATPAELQPDQVSCKHAVNQRFRPDRVDLCVRESCCSSLRSPAYKHLLTSSLFCQHSTNLCSLPTSALKCTNYIPCVAMTSTTCATQPT